MMLITYVNLSQFVFKLSKHNIFEKKSNLTLYKTEKYLSKTFLT